MESHKTQNAGTVATPCGIHDSTLEPHQQYSGQEVPSPVSNGAHAVPTVDKLNKQYGQNNFFLLIVNDLRIILMHTIVVFGRSRLLKTW